MSDLRLQRVELVCRLIIAFFCDFSTVVYRNVLLCLFHVCIVLSSVICTYFLVLTQSLDSSDVE